MTHVAYISIGSNLNDRIRNCKIAIDQITQFAKITLCSSFYETESWGYQDENLYINSVIKIETGLDAHQLLNNLKIIEKKIGRLKKTRNNIYESRVIDLDILFFDNLILSSSDLTIPHIHIYDRNYVLIPLNEIDSDFICPLKKDKISNLLIKCKDKSKVYIYPH